MELLNSLLISLPIADVGFAFRESSLPGKAIVLLLIFSSAGAWTIMLTKYWQLISHRTHPDRPVYPPRRISRNPAEYHLPGGLYRPRRRAAGPRD
jgi:hypothetical protein